MGNPAGQCQIVAKDPDAVSRFHAALFGWHVPTDNALGATVVVPKSELPDGDALAIVCDPAGLSFGMYRPRNSGTA